MATMRDWGNVEAATSNIQKSLSLDDKPGHNFLPPVQKFIYKREPIRQSLCHSLFAKGWAAAELLARDCVAEVATSRDIEGFTETTEWSPDRLVAPEPTAWV